MNQKQQVKLSDTVRKMALRYYFKYYVPQRNPAVAEATTIEQRKELLSFQYNKFLEKNLKYFNKVEEMFASKEEFEPETFIDAVLGEGFLYPPQLPVAKNWKIYLRNSQETETTTSSALNDAKAAKAFFGFLNGRTIKDITTSLILKNDLLDEYANDKLDLTVLCFSKAFKELAEKERMMIDFSEEQSKIDYRIKEKIKEKIGDDFFEEK
jgi:exonuclease I